MTKVLDNATYLFTWHTNWACPCKKCQTLDGRMYSDVTIYDPYLFDGEFGNIWDIQNDEPLTHPNCKCYLEVEAIVKAEDSQAFQELRDELSNFERMVAVPSNIKDVQMEMNDFDRDLARIETRMDNSRQQLMTYMMLLQRLGLPPEVERAISILVKFRMTAELATRSAYMLMAAEGPMGWGMAIASSVATVIGTTSIAMDLGAQ